ncbi:hypothetical protein GCM10029992_03910 [Glycomyces albus]
MNTPGPFESWLSDMDGVLVHEGSVPGANKLIEKLQAAGKRFLVLTNNSIYTPVICMCGCGTRG